MLPFYPSLPNQKTQREKHFIHQNPKRKSAAPPDKSWGIKLAERLGSGKEEPWGSSCLWVWSLPPLQLFLSALTGKFHHSALQSLYRKKMKECFLTVHMFHLLTFLKGEGAPREAPGWKTSKHHKRLGQNQPGKAFRGLFYLFFLFSKSCLFSMLFFMHMELPKTKMGEVAEATQII